MATASIKALKSAVISGLQARPGLDGVVVSWGFPTADPGPLWIRVGDVTGEQEAVVMGGQRRDEEYRLEVDVLVRGDLADDPEALAAKAFALAGEVELLLREDASLGLVVREAQIVEDGLIETTEGSTRATLVPVVIRARKRI